MYYNSNKLIPNIHFLGNNSNCFFYRNNAYILNSFFNNTSTIPFLLSLQINKKCGIETLKNIRYFNTLENNKNGYKYNSLSSIIEVNTIQKDNHPSSDIVESSNNTQKNDTYDTDYVLKIIKNNDLKLIDEYVFEKIDKTILTNLDSFRIVDLSDLLQLTLKSFYSQNLIESLVLKLSSSNPSDLQVSTIALILQNLGRLQPSELNVEVLNNFFDRMCDHLLTLENLSESHFSSIIYGFQRLHYSNYKFMSNIVKRYERDLKYLNINSLVISFSSLIKLNYFNGNLILNVYKIISKSLSNMNLQTEIQFINTISKVHEMLDEYFNSNIIINSNSHHFKLRGKDYYFDFMNGKLDKIFKQNSTLINNIMKKICNNQLENLNIVQVSLILNSLRKMNFRKTVYLSKLIGCIPSHSLGDYKSFEYNMANQTEPEDFTELVNNVNNSINIEDNNEDVDNTSSDNENHIVYKAVSYKVFQKNILSISSLPKCPFSYELTYKKLQGVDPAHLILICDAIFGLEYYSNHSLNLMFIIKDIINPILHELKSNNIMLFLLSFVNILFTNYQINRVNLTNKNKKSVSIKDLEYILGCLSDYDNYNNHNWFDKDNLISSNLSNDLNNLNDFENERIKDQHTNLLSQMKNRLNRSEWKEELVLSCFENLLRHVNFIKGSTVLLNKFKLLFSLLIHDLYVTNYPFYFNLDRFNISTDNSDKSDLSFYNKSLKIPAIIPENIVETLFELYHSSCTKITESEECFDDKEDNSVSDSDICEGITRIEFSDQSSENDQIIKLNDKTIYLNKNVLCFKVDAIVIFSC